VQQISQDLAEVGIRSNVAISGLGGSVSDAKMRELNKYAPHLANPGWDEGKKSFLSNLLGTVTGKDLPSLPKTIKARMAMQQDLVRSLQDSTLVSAGAITAEEADKRAKDRMADINKVVFGDKAVPQIYQSDTGQKLVQPFEDALKQGKFQKKSQALEWLKSQGLSQEQAQQWYDAHPAPGK